MYRVPPHQGPTGRWIKLPVILRESSPGSLMGLRREAAWEERSDTFRSHRLLHATAQREKSERARRLSGGRNGVVPAGTESTKAPAYPAEHAEGASEAHDGAENETKGAVDGVETKGGIETTLGVTDDNQAKSTMDGVASEGNGESATAPAYPAEQARAEGANMEHAGAEIEKKGDGDEVETKGGVEENPEATDGSRTEGNSTESGSPGGSVEGKEREMAAGSDDEELREIEGTVRWSGCRQGDLCTPECHDFQGSPRLPSGEPASRDVREGKGVWYGYVYARCSCPPRPGREGKGCDKHYKFIFKHMDGEWDDVYTSKKGIDGGGWRCLNVEGNAVNHRERCWGDHRDDCDGCEVSWSEMLRQWDRREGTGDGM